MKSLIILLGVLTCLLPTSIQAQENKSQEATVRLEPVVVTATKTKHKLKDVPVETILITREDIEKSNAKTISKLLSEIPGFNFSQQSDMPGGMGYKNTIRGLNAESRYMLVLVDGQRVFTGFRSGGMAGAGFAHNVNVVPVSMVERIEVVKGPGSALYGSDAMVGVLNIITKEPTSEFQANAGGSYGRYVVDGKDYVGKTPKHKSRATYESHATVSGPLNEKIKGTLSFSHEGNDGTHPTCYDTYQNYLHGQVALAVSDNFNVRAGAEIIVWKEQEIDTINRKEEESPRFWLIGEYTLTPGHDLKLQGYYQKLDSNFKDSMYGNQQADVSYSDVELQYTGQVFDSHRFTAGIEYLREDLKTNLLQSKKITTTSAYLQDEWSLLEDALMVVPGIRFDDNSDYGQEWNPKLSAIYKPFSSTRLRGSFGWSFKAPGAMETSGNPTNHGVMWIVSNPGLKPERAFTWQLSMEQELLEKDIIFGVTYYNSHVEDRITNAPTGATMGGLPVISYMNQNKADIQGVEATANFKLMEPLHLLLSYAYTDAKDGDTHKRLVDTPEHTFGAQLDYTNTEYRFGGSLSLAHASDQKNKDYGLPGASLLTKDHTTVGCKIWKDFWDHGRVSLEAQNIFDEPLRGSDTIYVRQSVLARIDFDF